MLNQDPPNLLYSLGPWLLLPPSPKNPLNTSCMNCFTRCQLQFLLGNTQVDVNLPWHWEITNIIPLGMKKIKNILIILFYPHIKLVTWKRAPHRYVAYWDTSVQSTFGAKLPWICGSTATDRPCFLHSQTVSWVWRHLTDQTQQEKSYFPLFGSVLMLETKLKGKK